MTGYAIGKTDPKTNLYIIISSFLTFDEALAAANDRAQYNLDDLLIFALTPTHRVTKNAPIITKIAEINITKATKEEIANVSVSPMEEVPSVKG